MSEEDGSVSLLVDHEARANQFRALARRMREADNRHLQREFRARLRTASRPAVASARAAALAIPDRSAARRRDRLSLRAEIAKAVRLQIREKGVRIYVQRNRLPADSRRMALAFERRRPFRHPVYARSNQTRDQWTWVQQTGHPWFKRSIRAHEAQFRRAVHDAMDDISTRITDG